MQTAVISILPSFELETGLFDGLAYVVVGSAAGNHKGIGGGSGLARDDPLHFADRLLAGSLAMVAVHALDGVYHCSFDGFLFFEFAEKFHT